MMALHLSAERDPFGGYLQGYVYINFHELSQYGWAMTPGFFLNFASIKR
jgi:hypothetical protein